MLTDEKFELLNDLDLERETVESLQDHIADLEQEAQGLAERIRELEEKFKVPELQRWDLTSYGLN